MYSVAKRMRPWVIYVLGCIVVSVYILVHCTYKLSNLTLWPEVVSILSFRGSPYPNSQWIGEAVYAYGRPDPFLVELTSVVNAPATRKEDFIDAVCIACIFNRNYRFSYTILEKNSPDACKCISSRTCKCMTSNMT